MRRTLVTVLAILLALILCFLVYMTQSVNFGRQVRVNGYLANLRALDAKWNESVLRARTESVADDGLLTAWRGQVGRAINGLGQEARELGDAVLVANVARLATPYDRKLVLMTQYWESMSASKEALRNVLDAVPAAQTQLRDLRASDPGPFRERLEDVRVLLDRLAATSMEFTTASGPRLQQQVQDAEYRLLAAVDVLSPQVRDALRRVVDRLGALRDAQPKREQLYAKIYYLPTGPRTDALGTAFNQSFQRALDQRELYRVYLIFYSAALLVLLAYLGSQLFRSYRVINLVNLQLRRANENLEHKVDVRTRELSDAMKHLKESEAMLVQSEKMSSLGQMVAGLVHEINTPLAYVKASLESVKTQLPAITSFVDETGRLLAMMQSGTASDEDVTGQFVKVGTLARELRDSDAMSTLDQLTQDGLYGIAQIADLVLNLKDFSRLDRTRVTRFDLREGIESTLRIARNLVKTKKVVRHFADIPPVACSPSQINQVFLNLVTNAAQATPDGGGTITITTRRVGEASVAVDVADDGRGIPADVLPRIFDPFFTTKDVGEGTGLGLAISYRIVHAHGGTITVDSKVGLGSRFTVTLPIDGAPSGAAA
ncbi:MAG: hypothetical protein GC151_18155 [Betaproteobacteria bacterium]|nr:hypothetical protein [Betaproteobacteria bacterium]